MWPTARLLGIAIALAALWCLLFTVDGGKLRDGLFVCVWLLSMLAATLVFRGRGVRTSVLVTVTSGVLAAGFGVVHWLPYFPDRAAELRFVDDLLFAGGLARPIFAFAVLYGSVGLILATIVRSIVERRRPLSVANTSVVLFGICAMTLAIRLANGSMDTHPARSPLMVNDYRQFVPMTIPATTEDCTHIDLAYERLSNLTYGPHGTANRLDLYLPKMAPTPRSLVIYVHGGGWAGGDKSEWDDTQESSWIWPLLSRGFAVASINYRLTRTHRASNEVAAPFPAQIRDCKTAIRFLRAHAQSYGLNPGRVGVIGHSAGGHLAALVGVTEGVADFEGDGWNRESSGVQAVVALSGLYDLRVFNRQVPLHAKCMNHPIADDLVEEMPNDQISRLLDGPVVWNMEKAMKASPTNYITAKAPPFLIVHGFRDSYVPPHQAEYFHCKLCQDGAESQLLLLPGIGHAVLADREVRKRVVEFLSSTIGQPSPARSTEGGNAGEALAEE